MMLYRAEAAEQPEGDSDEAAKRLRQEEPHGEREYANEGVFAPGSGRLICHDQRDRGLMGRSRVPRLTDSSSGFRTEPTTSEE